MTKADIINKIAEETGISKKDVAATVEAFMEEIRKSLSEQKENVYLRGFGSFNVKHAVLKPGQIQAGQAARIVGVLAGVHHGETPVAFQQDRIGIIRVQKMDAVGGKRQISILDRCNAGD